jgi:hypothetical protein
MLRFLWRVELILIRLLKYLLLICLSIFVLEFNSYAATIILNSGITIKGKLITRTDEDVTIQDPETKELRIIKSVFIRDLILDPEEQQLQEKRKLKKIGIVDTDDPLYMLQPEVGLLPGISYPFGKLGTKLALGYGATAFFDLQMPMKPAMFEVRIGLSAGFMYHPTQATDVAPQLYIVPITVYAKFQTITKIGVRPYEKLGGGVTPIPGNGMSIDPTFLGMIGLGYINNNLPYLEFFIEAGVMMAFESIRGDFVTASIGIAYRFGAPVYKK